MKYNRILMFGEMHKLYQLRSTLAQQEEMNVKYYQINSNSKKITRVAAIYFKTFSMDSQFTCLSGQLSVKGSSNLAVGMMQGQPLTASEQPFPVVA